MSLKRKNAQKLAEENEETLCLNQLSKEPVQPTINSTSSLDVNYDERSIMSDLSPNQSDSDDSTRDLTGRQSNTSSRYRLRRGPKIRPSNLTNFLDFISMCFWKCSTGCQQIPDKHY